MNGVKSLRRRSLRSWLVGAKNSNAVTSTVATAITASASTEATITAVDASNSSFVYLIQIKLISLSCQLYNIN